MINTVAAIVDEIVDGWFLVLSMTVISTLHLDFSSSQV